MLSQRLAEGGSAPELADTYHISLSSLYKWAANEGISYNRDQTKLTDEDKDDLIKHYLEGAEVERVIEEYEHLGFSRDVIGGFWELLAADDDLGDSDSNAQ
jgi:site-specific recombinase XerD